MGIDRKKTVIIGALIGAAFIGMGAVIQISYAGRVYATTGLGSLASIFQALACVLLSGSIASILSPPVGILVSSFFVVSIFNVLTMLGVPLRHRSGHFLRRHCSCLRHSVPLKT